VLPAQWFRLSPERIRRAGLGFFVDLANQALWSRCVVAHTDVGLAARWCVRVEGDRSAALAATTHTLRRFSQWRAALGEVPRSRFLRDLNWGIGMAYVSWRTRNSC